MPSIALTGGYGMGKTTVLQIFRKLGAFTVNSDEVVHNVLKKPEIIKKITDVLGEDILIKESGSTCLNRKHIADIIFKNPKKRTLVEKIIHPKVLKETATAKAKILRKRPSAIIIFEIPLLFEAGYEKNFDKVIVVFCKRDRAVRRLINKGVSRDEALIRMKAQLPITRKKALADFLIDNNNSIEKTEALAKRIFSRLSATELP